ncbi:MAG: hypothetical protein SGJ01_07520 [Gemmatimonadota bacterium]|nr:hypothetical protein [Gemmatimonadota bacterium]
MTPSTGKASHACCAPLVEERARLASRYRCAVSDTGPEAAFGEPTGLATQHRGTPIDAHAAIDRERFEEPDISLEQEGTAVRHGLPGRRGLPGRSA